MKLTDEQYEAAVYELTRILKQEGKWLKANENVLADRYSNVIRGTERTIRLLFGQEELDRVVNEAERRAQEQSS